MSFELQKGESLGLIGANGAGKTTVLKLLANITKPTSGHLDIHGQLSALIELGAGFHPDLTGRENVYLNGTILGLSRQEVGRNFDEIVAFSELERFIDTPVKRYSSGMLVRLGFAVASCVEPDILLVDEVLAVGDVAFRQKCMGRIHELLERGTSIIFVSHNFYLVEAVCSRALYLKKGEVKHSGNVKDAISAYEQDLHAERIQRFDMPERDRDGVGRVDLEITHVEVRRLAGGDETVLCSDDTVEIRISYDAYRFVGTVNVSVFIRRSDGLSCCMMRSKLDNYALAVDRGRGVVSLRMEPLQLVGGIYFAEAWFLDGDDSMAITPKSGRSDWFTVRGAAVSSDENRGVFEANTRWAHEPSNGCLEYSIKQSGPDLITC